MPLFLSRHRIFARPFKIEFIAIGTSKIREIGREPAVRIRKVLECGCGPIKKQPGFGLTPDAHVVEPIIESPKPMHLGRTAFGNDLSKSRWRQARQSEDDGPKCWR